MKPLPYFMALISAIVAAYYYGGEHPHYFALNAAMLVFWLAEGIAEAVKDKR